MNPKQTKSLKNNFESEISCLSESKWPQTIQIKNKTSFNLAVTIRYKDLDGDWVNRHKIVDSASSAECCKTRNKVIYYYAVDTHGYGLQISGSDNYKMNYYNTYVGLIKKRFNDDRAIVTLIE